MKRIGSMLLSLGLAFGATLSYADSSDKLKSQQDKQIKQVKEKLGEKKNKLLKPKCGKHQGEKKADGTCDFNVLND